MAIARQIIVTGRVQGVFFRAWTKEQADQLAVTGWVRNRPDGSVEAHVEGDELAIERMVELMRSGPSGAGVSDVMVEHVEPSGSRHFDIRPGGA